MVLSGLLLSSCMREEVPYIPVVANAAVEYEWVSGTDTYIEGFLHNDGETYISGVELEIRTFDDWGGIISYDWDYIYTDFAPGESVFFSSFIPVSYASDVVVLVSHLD